ncbi:MAG: hypothetical protein ACI9O6_002734 [Glaciecola sp.]|jgi:hypothetical protein
MYATEKHSLWKVPQTNLNINKAINCIFIQNAQNLKINDLCGLLSNQHHKHTDY